MSNHVPPEKPRTADVIRIKQPDPTRTYNLTNARGEDHSKPPGLKMGAGIIASIDVPKNWTKSVDRRYGYVTACSPNGSHGVMIAVDDVGIPVGDKNRAELTRLLYGGSRPLSPNEINWFEKFLNEQSTQPVKLGAVKVIMIDGKPVFYISGNFDYSKDKSEFESIYADVDGTASFLQRVFFAGEAKDFNKHKAEAQVHKKVKSNYHE
jgi:hypothetical protein